MPTSYTASLERKNFDLKRWLKEDIVRAFGICVSLRDEGDLSESAIREAIRKRDEEIININEKVMKAEHEYEKFRDMSFEAYLEYFNTEKEKAKNYYETRLKDFEEKKEKTLFCIKAVAELHKIMDKMEVADDLIRNSIILAKEQLLTGYEWDYSQPYYKPDILDRDVHGHRQFHLNSLFNMVKCRKEEVDKRFKLKSFLPQYDKFTEFVDTAMKTLSDQASQESDKNQENQK